MLIIKKEEYNIINEIWENAEVRAVPRNFPRYPASKGFSLIELIVYIGILSILVIITSGIFLSLNRGRGGSEAQNEVNSNLRFSLEKIAQDIRSAASVTTPATAGATSSSLVLVVGADTITYDVANGQLRRKVNSNQPEPITSQIVEVNTTDDPLTFTRMENVNSIFSPARKIISIGTALKIRFKSESSDWQYASKKITTVGLK